MYLYLIIFLYIMCVCGLIYLQKLVLLLAILNFQLWAITLVVPPVFEIDIPTEKPHCEKFRDSLQKCTHLIKQTMSHTSAPVFTVIAKLLNYCKC